MPLASGRQSAALWALSQRALAAAMLLMALPVLAAAWVAIKLTSPGPFLFRQRRAGLGGRHFTIFKVRTMDVGTEKASALGTTRKSGGVTRVGRLLRELKVDELPQLWNVVTGEMELVGPRPIPLALGDHLARHIPGFELRYLIKPGMTNVGQVSVADNGVGDKLLADWALRLEGELHYAQRKSLAYDLVVLALTALFILRKLAWAIGGEARAEETHENALPFTRVIGAPIANLDYDGVIERLARWIDGGRRTYVGVCPVHSLVEARRDPAHRRVLENAGLNTADGMPVAWAQRLLGHDKASRVYGPTLMLKTCERAAREGWRVAFFGGHPERLPILLDNLRRQFPGIDIVEAIVPPFRKPTPEEDAEHVERLRAASPDIIWVGLGCPKQERWMAEHCGQVPGVMLGVGAAFDFHAGVLRQAPPVLQKLGLEWAFRLWCEPRRLWRRYAVTNPWFIAAFAWQFAFHVLLRRRYVGQRSDALPLAREAQPTSTRMAA